MSSQHIVFMSACWKFSICALTLKYNHTHQNFMFHKLKSLLRTRRWLLLPLHL